MKKLILMAVVLLSSIGAFAQYEAGDMTIQPRLGVSASKITDNDAADWIAGFVGGAEFEYHTSSLFGVSAGIVGSGQGFKVKHGGDDDKWTPGYMNIPIMANFYVVKGLALKAGIQPGFMLSKDDAEGVKTFDFSIPVGASYEISHFVLDFRYNIGLTKIADGGDSKNSVFNITLGYKFKI